MMRFELVEGKKTADELVMSQRGGGVFWVQTGCRAPLHSTPLHSIPLHCTPLHSTALHRGSATTRARESERVYAVGMDRPRPPPRCCHSLGAELEREGAGVRRCVGARAGGPQVGGCERRDAVLRGSAGGRAHGRHRCRARRAGGTPTRGGPLEPLAPFAGELGTTFPKRAR
jgi:hypothetical protein